MTAWVCGSDKKQCMEDDDGAVSPPYCARFVAPLAPRAQTVVVLEEGG
ncbi:MAG: hypothetical protein J07HQW1_01933 [Haloquadratum walsbyi J07HQW1]|uniref:Uncharacterized protein n=1 Tax=Haloquadratum walsbyi J07HQW1 TaxID=1238424 RepID=U1MPN1_9EURY|nr:MAG: hypothetical protein J07HQW1_01933 [Haloquadratum walsbyi J07HQW1]